MALQHCTTETTICIDELGRMFRLECFVVVIAVMDHMGG